MMSNKPRTKCMVVKSNLRRTKQAQNLDAL